ncbi:hypothetical protein MLD38_027117 [Melastoma candidum]|nr:hypothetical protein MLD38_027117 [Melastoma candidum]
MLFFEGHCNCRHVVPIGSRFQAEIPPLESDYAKNKQMLGMQRMSRNHSKGRLGRVNKVENGPGKPYRQGRMI